MSHTVDERRGRSAGRGNRRIGTPRGRLRLEAPVEGGNPPPRENSSDSEDNDRGSIHGDRSVSVTDSLEADRVGIDRVAQAQPNEWG